MRRGRLKLLWSALGMIALLWISGCVGIIGPAVLVSDLRLDPGQIGILQIQVFDLTGLQVMQVGPIGALTFNPEVIHVEGLEGASGFQVFASHIDNNEGRVLFLIALPGGSVTDGVVMKIKVKAVGSLGSSTPVTFTQIDLLADQLGNELQDVKILDGQVTIGERVDIEF